MLSVRKEETGMIMDTMNCVRTEGGEANGDMGDFGFSFIVWG